MNTKPVAVSGALALGGWIVVGVTAQPGARRAGHSGRAACKLGHLSVRLRVIFFGGVFFNLLFFSFLIFFLSF